MTRAICRLYAKGIISFARAKPSDPIDRPRALEAGAAVVTGVLPWRGGCWPNHCCSESPALGFLQFRAASMVFFVPFRAVEPSANSLRLRGAKWGAQVSEFPLSLSRRRWVPAGGVLAVLRKVWRELGTCAVVATLRVSLCSGMMTNREASRCLNNLV